VRAASAFVAAGGVATLELSAGAVVLPYRSKEVLAHDNG
jgi:hypothetical protein